MERIKLPIHSLTSLRFFAAFGIVLYHLKYTMPMFFDSIFFENLANGVQFFFVLSGFILGYNYNENIKLSLKEFYVKRFARIYPLHLLTFIVWCLLFFSTWGNTMQEKTISGFANITLTNAFFPGLIFNLGYNAVSWSLSNEFFFYLLFPFIRSLRVSLVILMAVTGCIELSNIFNLQESINSFFPNFTYFSPLVRVSDFCFGIVIASLYNRLTKIKFATFWEISILFLLIYQLVNISTTIGQSILVLCRLFTFSALIWVFAHEQGEISKFLANSKNLIFLGEASFSLYMWHHMLLRYCGNVIPTYIPSYIAIFIAIAISIFISILSFKYFEILSRKFIINSILRKN